MFGTQETSPGGRIVRTIGIVRARAKIGLQNLTYNIRRLRSKRLERATGGQKAAALAARHTRLVANHASKIGIVRGALKSVDVETAAVQQVARYVAQHREARPSGARAPGHAAPQREVPPYGEPERRHAAGEPERRHAEPGLRLLALRPRLHNVHESSGSKQQRCKDQGQGCCYFKRKRDCRARLRSARQDPCSTR